MDPGELADAINARNIELTGADDYQELHLTVDEFGGLYGWTWGSTLWIDSLFIAESARRQGLGSRLLAAAESEGRARGCVQAALATHSFQAPDFYRRHGFTVAGEIPGYPAGHSYLLMRRALA